MAIDKEKYEQIALDALAEVARDDKQERYERTRACEIILTHVRGGEVAVVMQGPVPVRPVQRAGG